MYQFVISVIRETEGDDKESDEEETEDPNDLDKQMGDLGDQQTDKLDEQIWGSDDEDEADNETQVLAK